MTYFLGKFKNLFSHEECGLRAMDTGTSESFGNGLSAQPLTNPFYCNFQALSDEYEGLKLL
jgi:hypothetical protein